MDSPQPLRVRVPGGEYTTVLLVPGVSTLDVKEAIAVAVGLPMGTFALKSDAGIATVCHAGLTGNWNVLTFVAPTAAPGECVQHPRIISMSRCITQRSQM